MRRIPGRGAGVVLALASALFFSPLYLAASRSDTTASDSVRAILEQECINLNKDKLSTLIAERFGPELEKGLSPDLLKIMDGVIKRTDFDGIPEEKTVEIIGLVNGAHKKGAPLEFLDDIFDVAYVNTITVDQLTAAAIAQQEFHSSDVPQGIYEEFVYHSIDRERTGRGQYVDIAMVDSLFSVLENAVARYVNTGEVPGPLGGAHPSITPFQGFQTKDEQWVIAAVGNDKLWAQYCELLGRRDLIDHPKFKTNPLRCDNRKELIQILQHEMQKKTAQEWFDIFERHAIPYSPINTLKQICEDPHIAHRKMLVEIDQPIVGKMRICASPIKLSQTPGEVNAPAPMLGEHSEQVLRDVLGYSREKVAQLKEEGVSNTTV